MLQLPVSCMDCSSNTGKLAVTHFVRPVRRPGFQAQHFFSERILLANSRILCIVMNSKITSPCSQSTEWYHCLWLRLVWLETHDDDWKLFCWAATLPQIIQLIRCRMLKLFESFMRILGNAWAQIEMNINLFERMKELLAPLYRNAALRPRHLQLVLPAPLVHKCQHSTGSKSRWTLGKLLHNTCSKRSKNIQKPWKPSLTYPLFSTFYGFGDFKSWVSRDV